MAAGPATVNITQFAGFLKTNYARRVIDTVPDIYDMTKTMVFDDDHKVGEQFQQAVITQIEQGATYAASGAGPFSYNATVAGKIEKAIATGYQFALKSCVEFEVLAAAVNSGRLAYGSAADQIFKSMAMSARKRLEVSLALGQSSNGLGVVASTASTTDITFTDATWIPSMWIGMEQVVLEVFNSGLGTNRGTCVLQSVNLATKTIVVDAFPGGTVATDRVFFKDQRDTGGWNEGLGLLPAALTTSGNVWNIAVTKSVWGPQQYAVGGVLSFSVIQDVASKVLLKGYVNGGGGEVSLWIPPASWVNLIDEQAALRRYGGTLGDRAELVNGGAAIKFITATGPMMIKPYIYMPEGYAVMAPSKGLYRVGSTDVTFDVPGLRQPMVVVSSTQSGVDLICYYNQAFFTERLGQLVALTGITY